MMTGVWRMAHACTGVGGLVGQPYVKNSSSHVFVSQHRYGITARRTHVLVPFTFALRLLLQRGAFLLAKQKGGTFPDTQLHLRFIRKQTDPASARCHITFTNLRHVYDVSAPCPASALAA